MDCLKKYTQKELVSSKYIIQSKLGSDYKFSTEKDRAYACALYGEAEQRLAKELYNLIESSEANEKYGINYNGMLGILKDKIINGNRIYGIYISKIADLK